MRKAVLISIRPKWCELIANGEKTIEVRKTAPKIETPFKCYIYCTNGAPYLNRHNGKLYLEPKDSIGGQGYGLYERLSGKVIGEFVCDRMDTLSGRGVATEEYLRDVCLTVDQYNAYRKGRATYFWHISDLVIYDEPMFLSQMTKEKQMHLYYSRGPVIRAPQSWCYVEELP